MTTENKVYPDFSSSEYAMLEVACVEEILYYKRMHLSHIPIENGKVGRAQDSIELDNQAYQRNPGLEEAMLKAKEIQIKKYKTLLTKLENKDKEFSEEDIHALKLMCQEAIPSIKRHLIVKEQVDGSVSKKYARVDVVAIVDMSIKAMIKDYSSIIEKLAAIDTIPGDGFQGPTPFRVQKIPRI